MKQILQRGWRTRAQAAFVFAALCIAVAPLAAQSSDAHSATPQTPAAVPAQPSSPQASSRASDTSAQPLVPSTMPAVPGTPLDRVVAIVNGDLILDSDVNEEMRLEAFNPYRNSAEKPSRDRIIERLINRELILQQLKLQPEDGPSDADVNKQIDQLRKDIPACSQYHCESKAGWDHFLLDHGFTPASFFNRWKQRMQVLQFIDVRFQMGVNITNAEVRDYYEKTLLPEYKRQHAPAPKLDTIEQQIREVLVQQKITGLLSDWLQSLRAQGSVVVLHPGEEAP